MTARRDNLPDNAYISALNSLGEGVIITDLEGRVVFLNRQSEELLGWGADELYGKPLHEIIHYQHADGSDFPLEECDAWISLQTRSLRRNSDDVFTHRDGTIIPVSHVTTPMMVEGQFVGLTIAFHDIRERKRAEEAMRLQSTALSTAANAIFITDSQGNIEWLNRAFERMSGYSEAEVLGRNPRLLNSGKHDKAFFEAIWRQVLSGEVWRGEVIERHKDGHLYTVEQTITPILEGGKVRHFVAIHEDISERKQAEAQIRYMAMYDSLTGLPNRELLREHMQRALASAIRNERLVAVLFLDLDHFKDINDTLGHDIGDMLLQQVAHRLRGCVRSTDSVTRFGGDEFAIIQTDLIHVDGCAALAEKIVSSLGQPYHIGGHEIHSSASIGITLYPFDDGDQEQLLKHADMAMYRAKAEGRNNFQFFDVQMHSEVRERIYMETALRQGLSENQFYLVYQPQIALGDGEMIGMEALIRWEHPERGNIPPDEFIPIAESCGLIQGIGEWVLCSACQQVVQWQREGLDNLRVGVNLSAYQLREMDLALTVERILEETGLEGRFLELELTESMLMENLERSLPTLQRLSEMEVNLAIDDFGTGYSSLSYLSQLPVHRIKVDKSFVTGILDKPQSAAIADAVVNLGHSLGLDVLAEGVESEQQLRYLQMLGCDSVQGYYFSPPLTPEAFRHFVLEGLWWQNWWQNKTDT
jgi:diguanylate cyclase (GGDEF)-like protein/PAS domain S-box-containing protein